MRSNVRRHSSIIWHSGWNNWWDPCGQYVCSGHEAVAATQKRAKHSGTRIFTGLTKKDPHTERRKHVPVDRIPCERISIIWIPYERSAIDRIPYNRIPKAFPSMYAEIVNHAETSSQSTWLSNIWSVAWLECFMRWESRTHANILARRGRNAPYR